VDETAEEVTARGGHGIAVRCDHTVDADVEALFARIKKDHGRLDILVNNVWGGYEEYHRKIPFLAFWKPPFAERWQRVFEAGLRAHLHASALAAPLMIPQKRGLIVSTIAWDHDKFLGAVFYDLPKHALVRMIYGMAHELRKHNVAAIALAPGFMRTERVLATPASDWPGGKIDLSLTESPEYTGRAVRALATDPKVMEKSGRAFLVGEIAQEYAFTDIDGRKIPPFTVPES